MLIVVSFADRDGWNIRRAMAYVAIQQRARWTGSDIPRTPAQAQRWLDDPANANPDGLQKVSVLIALGNLAAATSALETYVPTTDVQIAGATRMRSYLRAVETGMVEMAPIRAAAANLAAEDRRYQLTAGAWMQVWLDIEAHRPWRTRFADAIRDLAPHPVPGRILAFIGFQQLAAPVATVIATAIMAVVLRLVIATRADQPTMAKARTGNVAIPRMRGGTAKKRQPVAGRAPRPVRCSTSGMPAPRIAVWAGRCGSVSESTLSESMPMSAGSGIDEPRRGGGGQERVVAEVGLRAPMLVPAGGDEHGSTADIDAFEGLRPDGSLRRATAVDEDALEVDDALQGQVGQVLAAGKSMRRRVDVGPGVRDEIDPPDLERRAGRVPGRRRLVRQERRDRRGRDARMGRHPVDDLVAQVDDAASGISGTVVPPGTHRGQERSSATPSRSVDRWLAAEMRQSRHDERRTEPERGREAARDVDAVRPALDHQRAAAGEAGWWSLACRV